MRPIPDMSTDKKMCTFDCLQYCENAASYFRHLVQYFGETLTEQEKNRLIFLSNRIKYFLDNTSSADWCSTNVRARYQRVLTSLQFSINDSDSR